MRPFAVPVKRAYCARSRTIFGPNSHAVDRITAANPRRSAAPIAIIALIAASASVPAATDAAGGGSGAAGRPGFDFDFAIHSALTRTRQEGTLCALHFRCSGVPEHTSRQGGVDKRRNPGATVSR